MKKPMRPREHCAKIVRNCEVFINTVEWWNNNRPESQPMDCEPERVLLPVARACLAAWDAGDSVKAAGFSARMVEIAVAGAAESQGGEKAANA